MVHEYHVYNLLLMIVFYCSLAATAVSVLRLYGWVAQINGKNYNTVVLCISCPVCFVIVNT